MRRGRPKRDPRIPLTSLSARGAKRARQLAPGPARIGVAVAFLVSAANASASAASAPAPADTPSEAEGQPPRERARGDDLASASDLDGSYVALGPRGAALYSEDTWDAAFGAEVLFYHHREGARVSLFGASAGFLRQSREREGQIYGEVGAGTAVAGGLRAGIAGGVTALSSPVRHLRWGGHATLWAFVGPVLYARAGSIQDSGMFADFGIRVALPAIRL